MFALRTALRTAAVRVSAAPTPALTRNFSLMTLRRPTVFGAAPAGLAAPPTTITGVIDTLASRISASPALQALQVRNGPRDTFDPSHRVRKRRAGFLTRNGCRTGRAILKRRRLKGRKNLSH